MYALEPRSICALPYIPFVCEHVLKDNRLSIWSVGHIGALELFSDLDIREDTSSSSSLNSPGFQFSMSLIESLITFFIFSFLSALNTC